MDSGETTTTDQPQQTALLDLDGKELNIFWVDEKQPLFVANNPLHWRAHKLQIAIQRMEKQQQSNPAQFNATVYFTALDKLAELMDDINKKFKAGEGLNEILGSQDMAGFGDAGAPPTDGNIKPISMDS